LKTVVIAIAFTVKGARMHHVKICRRAFPVGLLVSCGALLLAQEMPPVKDLPHTIGSASKTRGPLMLCALPDAGVVSAALDAGAKGGRRPFVIGWELQADPPRELSKIVLITSLPPRGNLAKENCKRVQRLPSGGADAMRLHTPYAAVDKATDWTTGYTSLVLTAKNDTIPAKDYVPRLKRHIRLVTQLFEPNGLDGYIAYAGEDFEWAYLHWVDQETSVRAFATPAGKTGPADSASFQHARGASLQIFPDGLRK
jgi:hypothetical protein